jgi:hypothetical protein
MVSVYNKIAQNGIRIPENLEPLLNIESLKFFKNFVFFFVHPPPPPPPALKNAAKYFLKLSSKLTGNADPKTCFQKGKKGIIT